MFNTREAERDHLYNRVVLLTIACCVLLGLAAMAKREGLTYAAPQWNGAPVTGTVTLLEDIPRNRVAKIVHYRYVDQDNRPHEGQYLDSGCGERQDCDADQDVTLIYSRWFPEFSAIASDVHTYRPGFYIMSGGILLSLLFFGISFSTLGRISAMKRDQAQHFAPGKPEAR
jgi:hypothetical protein